MYRTVDTTMWRDRWFARLATDARYLFVYLLTCEATNVAGCYELTVRQAAFDTGLPEDRVATLLRGELADRVCWWPEHDIVFVRNFFRRQWGDKQSPQQVTAARKAICDFPAEVRDRVGREYPSLQEPADTLSIPYGEGIDTVRKGTGSGTVIETGTEIGTASASDASVNGHAEDPAAVAADAYIKTLDGTFSKVAAKFVQLDPQFNRGWLAQAMRDAATKEVRLSMDYDSLDQGMMNAYERIAESLGNGYRGKGTRTGLARKIIFTALQEAAV